MIKCKGRMLRKDISKSRKIASLSKESLVLFYMIIPHLNSYGKMNGSPYFVKGEIVPLMDWFTLPLIEKCLAEISKKTNLKWFEFEGLKYIHSLSWEEHQELEKNRRGKDDLPSYIQVEDKSPTSHDLLSHEVEVEVEVKEEVKVEGVVASGKPKRPSAPKMTDEEWIESLEQNPAYQGIDIKTLQAKMIAWCDLKGKKPTRARLLNWLNREDKPMAPNGKTTIQSSKGVQGTLARIGELRQRKLASGER